MSAPATPSIPAGWYPDSTDPSRVRWWDGYQWSTATAYRSPSPVNVPQSPNVSPNTVWFWLVATVPTVLLILGLTIVWPPVRNLFNSANREPSDLRVALTITIVIGAVLLLLSAASAVLFAYVDWKVLTVRGIVRPSHWAFAFFYLIFGPLTLGVHVVGRTVVVRRQTGKGTGPVWVWGALTAVYVVISGIVGMDMFGEIATAFALILLSGS